MSIGIKQHGETDCGAACIASVAAYYKLKLPLTKIRQVCHTDKEGTNVLGLIEGCKALGFIGKGVKGDVESLSKVPLPVIAHIILKNQWQHYVVIYKVTKQSVTLMDPATGKLEKRSLDSFSQEWTGVLLLIVPNEDFRKGNEKTSNITRFWALLSPHKAILTQALVGSLVVTILGLSSSIYIQKITDYVLVNGNANLLNLLSVTMLVILLLQVFLSVIRTIFIIKTGQKIDARLILGYYKHLLRLPQRFFDTTRIGEITSRLGDAVNIRSFVNESLISLVVNSAILLFSFTLMFTYHMKLALIMVIIIPLYTLLYFIFNRLNRKQERKIMENSARLESQLVESLSNIRTIKQFGLEDYANIQTESRFVHLLRAVYISGLNSLFAGTASSIFNGVFTIILLWVGAYFVINNEITPGELFSFYALTGYFTGPVSSLVSANKTIQNAFIASDRLFEIIDMEQEETTEKIALQKEFLGPIVFDNLSFSYGTRNEVFNGFNLRIEQGSITALVGESGSGKTTLINLLQKLYPIQEGAITIGDYNLAYISTDSLRQLVGVVPQHLDLFADTIIKNIAVGEFQPDMKKIMTVCSQLGIVSMIEKFPEGFGTYLGENGATISGGEKQRLAIARAIYRDPEIILMDEATSQLDSAAEENIQQCIQSLKKEGKTIIIIAHRLSTVTMADKVVVLKDGTKIEEGTHRELIKKRGLYSNMWNKQTIRSC